MLGSFFHWSISACAGLLTEVGEITAEEWRARKMARIG